MANFSVTINTSKVDKLLDDLEGKLQAMSNICTDLCTIGAIEASLRYSRSPLDDRIPDIQVEVKVGNAKKEGYGSATVEATGKEVLFSEFGSGIRYGAGHPDPHGYGMGTFPSDKGHWDNPKGWYYKDENGQKKHSYGNAPSCAMYEATKKMVDSIPDVAKRYLK